MDNRGSVDHSSAEAPLAPERDIPELKNTGERFIPGTKTSAEVAYDHLTRYRLAERYVADKITLDMGCGTGYGTHSLSEVAHRIVGVDLSEEAVSYAAWNHQAPNLHYEVGDVSSLPYDEGSFEAIVSFEVIEHLQEPEKLVIEARRLLTEGGRFIVSSPDKQTYSNERNRVNVHHLKEMYPLEFRELLERHFKNVQIYWQGALAGSLISPHWDSLPEDGKVDLESAQFSLPNSGFGQETPPMLFMIAICTDGEAPDPLERSLAILDRDRQIYEEYDDLQHAPVQLRSQHNHKVQAMRHQNVRWQNRVKQLREQNERLLGNLNELRQQNKRRQRRIDHLLGQNEMPGKENGELNRLLREREAMINSRGWKIANGMNVFARKLRSILGGRVG